MGGGQERSFSRNLFLVISILSDKLLFQTAWFGASFRCLCSCSRHPQAHWELVTGGPSALLWSSERQWGQDAYSVGSRVRGQDLRSVGSGVRGQAHMQWAAGSGQRPISQDVSPFEEAVASFSSTRTTHPPRSSQFSWAYPPPVPRSRKSCGKNSPTFLLPLQLCHSRLSFNLDSPPPPCL